MRRLSGLLQLACQRDYDDVWAVKIPKIILENHAGAKAALLIPRTVKPHVVNIPDLRLSACVVHDVTPFRCSLQLQYNMRKRESQVNLKIYTKKFLVREHGVFHGAPAVHADDVKNRADARPVVKHLNFLHALEAEPVTAVRKANSVPAGTIVRGREIRSWTSLSRNCPVPADAACK